MTVNVQPMFLGTIHIGMASISTANTNRDGTGTTADLFTGGTNGSRIHRIIVKATGTTTAGMIRFFIYDGTNVRFWKEVNISAITPSATLQSEEVIINLFGENALPLPVNYVLRVSTHNAETFHVIAEGGDYISQ